MKDNIHETGKSSVMSKIRSMRNKTFDMKEMMLEVLGDVLFGFFVMFVVAIIFGFLASASVCIYTYSLKMGLSSLESAFISAIIPVTIMGISYLIGRHHTRL